MHEEAAAPHGTVTAERYGAHVLVHAGDEAARERSFLAGLPPTPGHLLVLASQTAYQERPLGASLADLLRPLLDGSDGSSDGSGHGEALWLAVDDLAGDTALTERLSSELGRDVLVPDGPLTILPGSGIHVGSDSAGGGAGTGWWRTRSDVPAWLFSTRFPVPRWQTALPSRVLEAGGAVAEPVLAGMAVRDARARPVGPGDPAFATALDLSSPLIVVGGTEPTPTPAAVAAVLTRLPPGALGRLVLVPGAPDVARDDWSAELATQLGRDVVTATGARLRSPGGDPVTVALDTDARPAFRPFATVLRRGPGDGGAQVVDVSAAPPGWSRSGERSYRPNGAAGVEGVRADVVPAGLVLRPAASTAPDPDIGPFDPTGWTLGVGVTGEPVGDDLLTAAEQLLAALGARQRASARVRLIGEWAGQDRDLLELVVPGPAAPDDAGTPDETGTPAGPAAPADVDSPAGPVAPPEVPAPVEIPDWSATASLIATTSATPEPTVTPAQAVTPTPAEPQAPGPVPEAAPPGSGHDRPVPDPECRPAATDPGPVPSPADGRVASGDPVPGDRTSEAQDASTSAAEDPAGPLLAAPTGAGPVTADGPAPAAGPAPSSQAPTPAATPAPPSALPDRASTAAEQNRFAAAAGEAFGDALATVNTALATWPALRHETTGGAKSDLVAVCLFLGRGDTGAKGVNDAVRGGRGGVVDGHLPCLVSGIRRLPSHRRAVLRQSTSAGPVGEQDTVGRYFTEPGFLSASMNLDVTLPGAGLDVLIWPTTARRTTELRPGRPVDEAVFLSGARFKALAVRTAEEAEPEPDVPEAPRTAVLVRELAPGEPPTGTGLDDRDLAALAKLDRALAARQRAALRLVDDPDAIDRLTTDWTELAVASDDRGRPAAAVAR